MATAEYGDEDVIVTVELFGIERAMGGYTIETERRRDGKPLSNKTHAHADRFDWVQLVPSGKWYVVC